MKLSMKANYAVRAAIALAANGSMTTGRIAAAQHIPKKFLEQILLAMKAAGLVGSKAGPKGGYELSRPADTITLGEILRAVEEPLTVGRTRQAEDGSNGSSAVERTLEEIRNFIRNKLDEVSLRELSAGSTDRKQVEELMWYI